MPKLSCDPFPRYGQLFTDFDCSWQTRSTIQWMQDCLLPPPNPLAFIKGFDIGMLYLLLVWMRLFDIFGFWFSSQMVFPLKKLFGFHRNLNPLRKHCAMHTNNLGLYAVLNAEGLIMLAQHRVAQWHCSLEEAMGHLYEDFRSWTHANKISCSHRRWRWHQLHSANMEGVPTFPFLVAKAYNARVILGWISVPYLEIKLVQFFGYRSSKSSITKTCVFFGG